MIIYVCLTVMKANHQSADAWKNCLMSRVRSYKELYMFRPIVLYINYFWGYLWCMPKIKSINFVELHNGFCVLQFENILGGGCCLPSDAGGLKECTI